MMDGSRGALTEASPPRTPALPLGYSTVPVGAKVAAGDLFFHPNKKEWIAADASIGHKVNMLTWRHFSRKIPAAQPARRAEQSPSKIVLGEG